MNRTTFILGLLMGLLLAAPLRAQQDDRATTEERLRALREQIAHDERRLAEATQAEEASLETLRTLDRELAIREELSGNYQTRLRELAEESDSLRTVIAEMDEELAVLKEQYRARAVHAYKYGRLHDLALILSASSINQMLIRVRYLNRFADQRRTKLEAVNKATEELETRRAKLVEARVQTQLLLREAQEEQTKMQRVKKERSGVIQKLQNQRTTLTEDLTQKRAAASAFEQRIRNLIAAANEKRRARAARDPREEVEFAGLSGSFLQNRGRLPWPAIGVIVEPFGEVVNPVHGTTTPNPGLLIATRPQAEVRAVFDGTVLAVSVLPEFGTYVAIQHGEYQSVYSNFSMVYVGEGTQVTAGELIGRAGTDAEPKQSGIFFGLFKDGEPFDPTPWLQSR